MSQGHKIICLPEESILWINGNEISPNISNNLKSLAIFDKLTARPLIAPLNAKKPSKLYVVSIKFLASLKSSPVYLLI